MATYHVPGDSATIQGAIDLASSGDTVIVDPGTYEEKVTIDESITLVSSIGPADTIIDPPAAVYYLVSIEADDVTLDGFTITNPDFVGTADASGISTYYAGRKSNIHITNCIIRDIGPTDRPTADFGTYGINSGPVDGLEIDHTVIYNIGNADVTGEAAGILIWGVDAVNAATNLNIHDNQIYNIIHPTDYASGIRLAGYTADAVVSGNTITPDVKMGIVTSSLMSGPVTITNNTVNGATLYGLLLQSPTAQTVTGNTIKNTDGTGIMITASSSSPVIHNNNIYRNGTSLDNESAYTVDATDNWWGIPDGPGTGDIMGAVDYTPWLREPYPPGMRGVRFW